MDYLQTLFGFFNAPLFATFILGMFWKRDDPNCRLDGLGRRESAGKAWFYKPVPLGAVALGLTIILNIVFH